MKKQKNGIKVMRIRDLIIFLLIFPIGIGAIALLDRWNVEELAGSARAVDGDSLVLNGVKMRLMGIDAPELSQTCHRGGKPWKCGRKAKAQLAGLVGSNLNCTTHGKDRYARKLVICFSGGIEINAAMVRGGWAVDYGGYFAEEAAARSERVGIWGSSFDRPQEWRRTRGSGQEERVETGGWPGLFQNWWNRLND